MLCLVTIVLHSSDIACPWFAADVGRGLPNSLLAGRSLHSLDTKLSGGSKLVDCGKKEIEGLRSA